MSFFFRTFAPDFGNYGFMKTIYSYLMSFLLLAAVVFTMSSCDEGNGATKPAQMKQLAGTWRVYSYTAADQKTPQVWWYRFDAEGAAERFWYDEENKRYVNSIGTCVLVNNWLTIEFDKEFIYQEAYDLMRGLAQFQERQAEWGNFQYLISSHTKKEIKVLANGQTLYFKKEALDPTVWPAECAEAEQDPTVLNLVGQWDLRSYYELNGNIYQTWFFETPETQGMTIAKDGAFQNMQFLANDLAFREKEAGRLEQDEAITIYAKDCAWMLINGMLDFVCTQYDKVKYDDRGAETSREVYTPETPIHIYYKIHFFTGNWLTLYAPEENLYFSFRRNTSAAVASQKAVSRVRKGIKIE